MKVYELIEKLLKARAGANVYIRYSNIMDNLEHGEETIADWVSIDEDGNVYVSKRHTLT